MQFAHKHIDLTSVHIMGVLNVTPDSFYSNSRYFPEKNDLFTGDYLSNVLRVVEDMVVSGASFIDIGGESTRPGAEPVTVNEELDRVIPVVEAISKNIDVVISVDTSTS